MGQTRVVVVGGGPAGSSAAWHLARAGIAVTLLDRARFPRAKPCAEYLSPEAARLLSAMGALDEIDAAGSTALTGMSVHAPNGAVIRGEFAAAHGFRGFRDRGIGCRREILDTILLARAREAGVDVREGCKVDALRTNADGGCSGVTVRDADGMLRELDAPIVIGADGLRSVVAHRLGLARRARWPRRLAIMAHYRGVGALTTHGEMHVTPRGYFGIAEVAAGIANVALVLPARAVAARRRAGHTPEQMLQQWIHDDAALRARFADAQPVSPVRVTGPFASHARRAWAPGAALVGDAADFFDPFTGEGIYAALRGGELLAPFVAEALGHLDRGNRARADRALAAYDVARTDAFRGKWRVERLIGLGVAVPWLMNRAARVLSRDTQLAHLLVGVTGDFVPPSAVLTPRTLLKFLLPRLA